MSFFRCPICHSPTNNEDLPCSDCAKELTEALDMTEEIMLGGQLENLMRVGIAEEASLRWRK